MPGTVCVRAPELMSLRDWGLSAACTLALVILDTLVHQGWRVGRPPAVHALVQPRIFTRPTRIAQKSYWRCLATLHHLSARSIPELPLASGSGIAAMFSLAIAERKVLSRQPLRLVLRVRGRRTRTPTIALTRWQPPLLICLWCRCGRHAALPARPCHASLGSASAMQETTLAMRTIRALSGMSCPAQHRCLQQQSSRVTRRLRTLLRRQRHQSDSKKTRVPHPWQRVLLAQGLGALVDMVVLVLSFS